jgi:EmrB/QacA subfamily drug resistance transporter
VDKKNSPWLALIIVLTAPLLSVIDVFIVNVAVPAIQKGIHAADGQIQLVIAGYLLGYASFLITGGRAGDQFGRKKVFVWGMLSFTLFSCLCGLSQTPLQLIITRFFQGLSASFMVPQTIAFIQMLFPDPKERAKAIGFYGITLGAASIIGQILGGYLSETHFLFDGWRLIFIINLPIGAVALWAAKRYLFETEKPPAQRFDYSGIAILTTGLICLIYPIIQGRESGWPLWSVLLLVLSLFIFLFFIYDQQRKLKTGINPLIDVSLFHRGFNLSLFAVLFEFMMHTSYLLTSAVFLQKGLNISPLKSGIYFIIPGVLFTLSSMIASKLVPKFGKLVPLFGVIITCCSFALQVLLFKANVSGVIICFLMGLYGLGNGFILPTLLNLALRTVPQKFAGSAAGVYSTFQQTASALGICIIGGIFYNAVSQSHSSENYVRAFMQSTTANIICLLLTGLMLLLLPKNSAAKA